MERLFKIFGRIDVQNRTEGIGLGLAVCKSLCDKIGARIGLKSVYKRGSSFYILLKLSEK